MALINHKSTPLMLILTFQYIYMCIHICMYVISKYSMVEGVLHVKYNSTDGIYGFPCRLSEPLGLH